MPISPDKKKEIIQKILATTTFRKATTSSALLQYLLKAHLNEDFLKEGVIDIDFFGNKGVLEKSNTRVRVSMYNLRKKLDSYYEGDGASDDVRVFIDKGQYSLRFEKVKFEKKWKEIGLWKKLLPYGIILVLITAYLVQSIPAKKPKVWEELLSNGKNTTLYVGDVFGFKGETLTGGQGWTRDYNVNSLQQYYDLTDTDTLLKEKTFPSSYNYTTGMGVHSAHQLTKLFVSYKQDFKVGFTTQTKLADLKKGNGIYVGSLFNENDFITLFNNYNPYFNIERYKLTFKGNEFHDPASFRTQSSGEVVDYAIVSSFKGPENTHQMVFFSNHDMGVEATVKLFTNSDSLKVFEKKYLKDHKYFTALYKATGQDRTSLDLENVMVVPF